MAIPSVPSATQYTTTQTRRERSFAELYRQARQAQVNDNGAVSNGNAGAADQGQQETESRRNLNYIADLHDRVDTLRGEILARVINGNQPQTGTQPQDIGRLNTRLESLRTKLREEEQRLSGHLVDVTV